MISSESLKRLEEAEKQQKAGGGRIPPSGVKIAPALFNSDYREVPCRSCGELVVWMKTKNGKNMPVNAKTAKFGDALFDSSKGHVSHFATCPNANEHRNPR